jgi:uncharacterized protein YbjQ (UPF0145 family)
MKKPEDVVREFEEGMKMAPAWAQNLFGGDTLWEVMLSNGLQVFGIGLFGWFLAAWFERRHLASMSAREKPLQGIRVNTSKTLPNCEPEGCTLLIGSVVVAHDYFRTLIIVVRRFIGGNIKPYERLVQRGRREALIRLKEEAEMRGIDQVVNIRFGTSAVTGRFLHAIEMVAYGTGIRTQAG